MATTELPAGTVTFVFTDIEGSTRRWEEHPDAMATALQLHDGVLHEAVARHNGVVFSSMGDGVAAAFPSGHDAVRAVLELQQQLPSLPWPEETAALAVRAGVHTADAVIVDGQYLNQPLNRCARLMGAAHGGQVLISGDTAARVQDRLPEDAALEELGTYRFRDVTRPMRVFQLVHPDLPTERRPLRSVITIGNLPVTGDALIGRAEESAQVRQALERARLVAITGPGGVGKTSLALEVGRHVNAQFPDGVWCCDLSTSDSATVALRVATALGVIDRPGSSPLAHLVEAARDKKLLLILDNCEHVLDGAAVVIDAILSAAIGCRILVTSREPIGLAAEHVIPLAPLRSPQPAEKMTLGELMEYDAVRLFSKRASQRDPMFAVTENSVTAVATVCSRLDGIPLALELAAARVHGLGVNEVADRLDERFSLLTKGSRSAHERQRTLRALVDWSYDLLDAPQRFVLLRSAVFQGGCDLAALQGVCVAGGMGSAAVADVVDSLVDKSLIDATATDAATRYTLLETIRAYASDRFAQDEPRRERAVAEDAHADVYRGLTEFAARELNGPKQVDWMKRLEVEHDNVLAALRHATRPGTGIDAGLRFANSLQTFWLWRGRYREGIDILEGMLARPETPNDGVLAVQARVTIGWLRLFSDQWPPGERWVVEGLELAELLGDRALQSDCRWLLSGFHMHRHDFDTAERLADTAVSDAYAAADDHRIAVALHMRGITLMPRDLRAACADFEESLRTFDAVGDPLWHANVLNSLAEIALVSGDLAVARQRLETAYEAATALDNRVVLPSILAGLAVVSLADGDSWSAVSRFSQAFLGSRSIGDVFVVTESLLGLAVSLGALGDAELAAQVHGACDAWRDRIEHRFSSRDQAWRDQDQARLREVLGDDTFETSYRVGYELDPIAVSDLVTWAADASEDARSTAARL